MIEIIPNWHPFFVHFTVALYITSTILLVVGASAGKKGWAKRCIETGYINLWLGSFFTIVTLLAGFHAYSTVESDEISLLAVKAHMYWALISATLFFVLSIFSMWLAKKDKVNKLFLLMLIISTSFVIIAAWKGAELVYRYGLGVL